MRDPLRVISEFFEADEDQALDILLLTQWVDQEIATEIHGYPKDNLIPAPMEDRLADPEYRRRLLEAAEDQAPGLILLLRAAANK